MILQKPNQVAKQPQQYDDYDKFDEEETSNADMNVNDFNDDDYDLNDDYGGEMPALEKHSELLRTLTNFNPNLREKFYGWLGMYYDAENKKWVKNPLLKPITNAMGAHWGITLMDTYARDNNVITHIREEDYNNMYMDIIDNVWMSIGTKPEEFDMWDYANTRRMCMEIEHTAMLALMGAGDGKYSKMLSETVRRTENISSTNAMGGQMRPGAFPNPPKKGLVNWLKSKIGS